MQEMSAGFKACNCKLHRLRQDVEFVDTSLFCTADSAPSVKEGKKNLPDSRREKKRAVQEGIGLMCGCRMHDVKQAADAVEDGEAATEESASRALSLFNAIRMTSDPGINPHRAAHLKFSVPFFLICQ